MISCRRCTSRASRQPNDSSLVSLMEEQWRWGLHVGLGADQGRRVRISLHLRFGVAGAIAGCGVGWWEREVDAY